MKTSELTGAALDWAVAKCEGLLAFGWKYDGYLHVKLSDGTYDKFIPSTSLAHGGPIIEQERMEFDFDEDEQVFRAYDGVHAGVGPTHLIAAMRCYVASRLGESVEVPEELK